MFISLTVCIQTIAHQLIQPLLEQPMTWAPKSMESRKNVKTRWRENQCLGLEGQDAQHHTRLLSVDASFPLRGFYTPANSRIQRYIRCMTLGLVKSTAKQYQLKKSDTVLDIMWPAYNYTPTCTHIHLLFFLLHAHSYNSLTLTQEHKIALSVVGR